MFLLFNLNECEPLSSTIVQVIDDVQLLILDEADELLAPHFKEQINRFLEDCPQSKQMMLFSATMPKDIKDVVERYNSYIRSGLIASICYELQVFLHFTIHRFAKINVHVYTLLQQGMGSSNELCIAWIRNLA